MVAPSSKVLTQLSAWTLALAASSLDLKDRMMLLLGSRDVLHRAVRMSIPPFSGSLKWANSRTLHLAVSSVTGSLWKGASLLVFFMDMNISFSWASGRVAGLGSVGRFCETVPWAAEAYVVNGVVGWEVRELLMSFTV